jgi:hypothetical protein
MTSYRRSFSGLSLFIMDIADEENKYMPLVTPIIVGKGRVLIKLPLDSTPQHDHACCQSKGSRDVTINTHTRLLVL